MLRRLINDFSPENIVIAMYYVVIYMITVSVHETAHGYAAYKMGDNTAMVNGRLTLNPMKHIDPFGLLLLLVAGFGWARPVPINPRNFRNPKKGMAISALAGPVSNFLMAFIGVIIHAVFRRMVLGNMYLYMAEETNFYFSFLLGCMSFFMYFYMLNVYFGIFNLLPVPPLDGSRIVDYFLPYNLAYKYAKIERYGFLILMLLIMTDIITGPLTYLAGLIIGAMEFIVNLVPFLRI